MSRLARATTALCTGFAIAAALFWVLLNVPESNVATLSFSAALLVLAALAAGMTIAVASSILQRLAPGRMAVCAIASLPAFAVGLILFAALWWISSRFESSWLSHRGEIDAVLLRYFNIADAGVLHRAARWLAWFIRLGVGLSAVVALVVAGTRFGIRGISRGMRDAVRPGRLFAGTLGVLLVTQVVSRLLYWRPQSLPANRFEIVFAAVKFGAIYLMAAAVAAIVIAVYSRPEAGN